MTVAWFRPLAVVVVCCALLAPLQAADLPDFTPLVEQQGAAVVNVSAIQQDDSKALQQLPFPNLDESDPMFDLFRRLVPRRAPLPEPESDGLALGSGFIISADGYILTNAHVVNEAAEILVRLADKREYFARVIGADERSDVALLKIDASALPVVVLGDPARLKVGEWVLAIGSPFGFEQSVTAGIVSAKGRALPDENFVPFIQTDVAINPGNSGGPLFNLKGEVVGINSQIYSRTGGFMGLSFAIPIDVAMDVQQQLRSKGRVERGRIGVAIQEVTRDLADGFALPEANGALVSMIEPDSPAARAGLQQGDVILRFAGRAVGSSSDLPRIVAAVQPGSRVQLELWREGRAQQLDIEIGEWPDAEGAPAVRQTQVSRAESNRLGLVLAVPTVAQKREQGGAEGLVVDRVEGAAARAEIRPGDRVLSLVIDGRQHRLQRVDDFNRLVDGLAAGQKTSIFVQRGEIGSYVSLRAAD